MPIEPSEHQGGSLLDYVDAALEGMKDDLEPADLGTIGALRKLAMVIDLAEADGKSVSVIHLVGTLINGIEKLGGTAMGRKQIGKKQDKPKSKLAEVRALRGGDVGGNGQGGAKKRA